MLSLIAAVLGVGTSILLHIPNILCPTRWWHIVGDHRQNILMTLYLIYKGDVMILTCRITCEYILEDSYDDLCEVCTLGLPTCCRLK